MNKLNPKETADLTNPHRRKIVLVGVSGFPNWGDEMIAKSWIAFHQKTFPGESVRIESPHPGITATLLSGFDSPVESTDTLWRLIAQTKTGIEHTDERLLELQRFVSHGGTPIVDLGIQQLRDASAFHLIGGGYLNSIWPEGCLLAATVAMFPRTTRKIATGAGLMPQDNYSAGLLNLGFQEFSHISVRDEDSKTFFEDLVEFGLDDFFLGLNREIRDSVHHSRQDEQLIPQYMLLLQKDFFENQTEAESLLELALTELKSNGWNGSDEIGLVEAIPGADQDGWYFFALERQGIQARFFPFSDVWSNGFPATKDQYWVTTRFHPHLYLAAHGIRGTAITLNDYYFTKHQSLTRLGTGWKLVNLDGETLEAARLESDFPSHAERLARIKWEEALRIYS